MKKKVIMMMFSIMFLMPGLSHGQEREKPNETVVTMEEVVVTATKTEEKRGDVPNSVILKDEWDIRESSAENLGELLANELGIDWRTYGNYGGASQELKIRGMSGDGTQVFINGINVNSPSIGTADLGKVSLNSIERIELVKGAGSLLYGSGAMGGTLNIITKGPERSAPIFRATGGYGANNTYLLSAEQGMFLFDDFGYYLTAERKETDGFRDNSDLTQNDVSLKLILDKGDELKIDLYGDYLEREAGLPGVKPPAGTPDYYVGGTQFYNAESASLVDRSGDKDGHLSFRIKSSPSEQFTFNIGQAYSDMEGYNYHRDVIAIFPKLAGEGMKTWVTNKVAVSEVSVDIRTGEISSFLVGGEYRGYDYKREIMDLDTIGRDKPGTGTSEKHHVFTKGAFLEGQFRLNDYLKILAGGRYEKHSTFGHETLPRYGLIISPRENTAIKINHGKHFKAPTLNDLYWPDDGWMRGDTNLRPEKGWHSDVTLEQTLSEDRIFISGSYFRWNLKDKIAWAENPNYPTVVPGWNKWTPSNVETYRASGWELGLRIRPFNDTMISLSYTALDATEKKMGGPDRPALYTADSEFKGDITHWFDFGLTAKTTFRFVGDRPAYYESNSARVPKNTIESYWTMDLNLEYELQRSWILSLKCGNLFNKEYDTYMQNFTDQDTAVTTRQGYPGAGRSLFFSVSYEY